MATEITLFGAFLVGLLGSAHCFGMCGGIVGALTLGLPAEVRERPLRLLPYQLAYNGGRILSYALAGALAGLLGQMTTELTGLPQAQAVLQGIAGAFMVLLGFYLAGWSQVLARVERAGAHLWRRLEPVGRRLVPVRNLPTALGAGLVWGWLPCGLVYSVLVWAVAAGGALEGAGLMLAFGLGTWPAMVGLGVLGGTVAGWVRRPAVRQVAGGLVIVLGAYLVLTAIGGGPPMTHHH